MSAFVKPEELLARQILVIDDEEANLLLIETLLKREGYTQIVCLQDPSEAMDTMVAFDPHIILLDLMMPETDGYQLLEMFRRQARPDEFCPVIVLTADTTMQARRRALALGAKDFLVKPFDAIEIGLRLANLLETQILYDKLHARHKNS